MDEPRGDGGGDLIETRVGLCVVLLATFLGLCNVKASNIAQQMQVKQAERNNNWAWFQARNLRLAVYEATAESLGIVPASETPDGRAAREAKAESYRRRAKEQEEKSEQQKADAEEAGLAYERLAAKDDQFDLCEAALALGLALMGVTALAKKRWLFWVALVPSAIGVAMGTAGFLGVDTNYPGLRHVIELLS